jgi:biopolymer transport protein ExbB
VQWAFLDDFAIDFVHLALKSSFILGQQVAQKPANKVAELNKQKPAAVKEPREELIAQEAHA